MRGGHKARSRQQQELRHQQQRSGNHRPPRGLEAARHRKHRSVTLLPALLVVVKDVDGVVHGDAEHHASDQHGRHVEIDPRRPHQHEDEEQWRQVRQHADHRRREGSPQHQHDQEDLPEGTEEAVQLADHKQVFLVGKEPSVAGRLPFEPGVLDLGDQRIDLVDHPLDRVGAMHVHIEQDAHALVLAIDELLEVAAIVDQQQLAQHTVVVGQTAEGLVFLVEGPIHLLDDVHHR